MSGDALRIERGTEHVGFAVHVQPRASANEIVGLHGDALKVRVQSPPVEGLANELVIDLLALVLGVSRRDIRIVAGNTSRRKLIRVETSSPTDVEARLLALVT